MLCPSCRRNRSAAKNSRAAPLPFSAMTRALPLSRHSRKRVAGASPFLGAAVCRRDKARTLLPRDIILFFVFFIPRPCRRSAVKKSELPLSRCLLLQQAVVVFCAASRRDGMLRPSCRRNRSAAKNSPCRTVAVLRDDARTPFPPLARSAGGRVGVPRPFWAVVCRREKARTVQIAPTERVALFGSFYRGAGRRCPAKKKTPARPLTARRKSYKCCINIQNFPRLRPASPPRQSAPAIVSRHSRRSALYRAVLPCRTANSAPMRRPLHRTAPLPSAPRGCLLPDT